MSPNVPILAWFSVVCGCLSETIDYRQTYIKPGYGVNYEKVDNIVTDGGTSFYTHTWALPWLTVPVVRMPYFNCLLAADWSRRCVAINSYIRDTNNFAYEMLALSARLLRTCKKQIPASRIPQDGRVKRTKRDQPSWLKPQTSDYILDYLPTHVSGQIWADLTSSPGPREIRQLKEHLRSMGSAVYANIEGIKQFEADTSSLSQLINKRIGNLVTMGNVTNERLQKVIDGIQNVYSKTGLEEDKLRARMDHTSAIGRELITKILPVVADFFRATVDADIAVKLWASGISSLTRGYISPFLVPQEEIEKILSHVSQKVLKRPLYSGLRLPSASAAYYYGLKTVAYTHLLNNESEPDGGTTLYVSLSIPLFKAGYTLPVYRIDTYPVPVTAGIAASTATERKVGFTLLKGLPDFIAVSDNEEVYVELEKSLFLSCSGYPQAKICSSGMPSLKKRRSGSMSCAFAIFIENREEVLRKCDFRYVNTDQWKPYGTAVQLSADSTFLVHASQRGPFPDRWRLSCPMSPLRPQTVLPLCNMCRIKIPCFCTMSGADFYLPSRYTDCMIANKSEQSTPTYLYHMNIGMIQRLFPNSAEAKLTSYAYFNKKRHPPFSLPNITFTVEDNFTNYVDISDKFAADLNKTLRNQQAHLAAYSVKEDAALARVRNFSDQVVDRSGNLEKALKDLFDGVFGGKIGLILAAIFSPLGIICIAFILTAFEFVPDVTTDVYVKMRQRKADKEYYIMLNRVHHMDTDSSSDSEERHFPNEHKRQHRGSTQFLLN